MVFETNVDDRLAPKSGIVFLNISGSEEAAIVERNYQDALSRYPTPKTCQALKASITSLTTEIRTWEEKRVTSIAVGGSGRPEQRSVDGFNKRLNELKKFYNEWYCDSAAEKEEHQQYLDDFNNQLSAVKSITGSSDSSGTVIVVSMLGVIVVVAGIFIFRKTRKSA